MMKRDECFRVLARHVTDEAVVATYSSAVDWVGIKPRVLNYTSIGAMGLDISHGLGLALGRPDKRVIVLQGDGSLLMNLGSLVTVAAVAPKNLVHFVAHNETYEANGDIRFRCATSISPALHAWPVMPPVMTSPISTRSPNRLRTCSSRMGGLRHAACRAVEAADLRLSEPVRPRKAQGLQSRVAGARLRQQIDAVQVKRKTPRPKCRGPAVETKII